MSKDDGKALAQLFIKEIARDAAFQMRNRLDLGAVKRYEGVYSSHKEMPPVQVARVDDVYILVDGWHRVTALENLGVTNVEAWVTIATREEALWMSAKANLEHGVPLKANELRAVFRAYVKAKKHLLPRRKLQSYRDIGAELGKPAATIYNWMKKDFPRVAAQMGAQGTGRGVGGLPELPRAPHSMVAAHDGIRGLLSAFQGSTDAAERGAIIEMVEDVLKEMKGSGSWRPSIF